MPDTEELSPTAVVAAYHERTKHHFGRYAAALGYLDWATQPNPFRSFAGAATQRLPLDLEDRGLPYRSLYSPGAVAPAPFELRSLSRFLRYALSITAWKEAPGARWSLRANPSSGNLHPTEGYLVLPALDGFDGGAGVWHYAPRLHALERRAALDTSVVTALLAGLPAGSFLVGLSSLHWREAWKYGERAYRYCQHDVGHALGALRLAAAALGWKLRLLGGSSDADIAGLLGLDREQDFDGAELEEPDLIAAVTANPSEPFPAVDWRFDSAALAAVHRAPWSGRANALSSYHACDWPVIDEVAHAARFAGGAEPRADFADFPAAGALAGAGDAGGPSAHGVILGRRSALSFDGLTSISRAAFLRMLGRLMPARGNASAPFDSLPWRPRLHLGLYVHRVEDLPSGLYALVRDPARVDEVRAAMSKDFRWEPPGDTPASLPLYLLTPGDVRATAATVSCGQEIASDGAFAVTMLAAFDRSLATDGAHAYRRLHWEAGLIGQVLYLEAEDAGLRATGIGCYFDDPTHRVFGLEGTTLQSLYHFTVGRPMEDARLTTLPAYGAVPEEGPFTD